jgi:hypothetical protein
VGVAHHGCALVQQQTLRARTVNLDHHVITILQYILTFHLRTGIIDNDIYPSSWLIDKVAQQTCLPFQPANPFPGICPRSSPPITPIKLSISTILGTWTACFTPHTWLAKMSS